MEFFSDVGGDPLKPSLFELVAQEQLRDLLQPAVKYVLSVSKRPSLQGAELIPAHVGVCAEIPEVSAPNSEQA